LTLSDIARKLRQKYPQSYRSISALEKKGLIKIDKIGKSKLVKLDFSILHPEYALAEIERLKDILANKMMKTIAENIYRLNKQFICILFGSFASGKSTKESDIDLLFISSDSGMERAAKNNLSRFDIDLNVISEDSLFDMWSHPDKLNIGNEIFKNHVVLFGSEAFINLVRKHHVGR
jgi:predicted nucleotidyltransferase